MVMNEQIKKLSKQSGIDVYGLGKDREKWENSLEKFANLIVQECVSIVDNQGKFLRFTDLSKKIKQNFGVDKE
jgi:hypothetical protein